MTINGLQRVAVNTGGGAHFKYFLGTVPASMFYIEPVYGFPYFSGVSLSRVSGKVDLRNIQKVVGVGQGQYKDKKYKVPSIKINSES